MISLKTFIVDDKQMARRVLREELEQIPGVLVTGEAENGKIALQMIERDPPDLVFLDLQMPEVGGFEVIQGLGRHSHPPVVVVVTAFDQHAIQALEAGAVDFILKPAGEARLIQSVERARRLRLNPAETVAELRKIEKVV